MISGFGASARPSLAELATLSGIPAKIGGIDGPRPMEKSRPERFLLRPG
ncbi:hypothetical protein IYY11_12895 [Methylocystis sp. H62]|nr:hypothetical protein [Methylocystis sp. H62]